MQLINNELYRFTTFTHHFPDKRAGYKGGKLISNQTWMKVTNLGATTKR